jgi:probable HAF family extracellular repeat protein
VGNSYELTGSGPDKTVIGHAFLYSGGAMVSLGTLGGPNSFATGINAAGLIVGNAEVQRYVVHPFLDAGGRLLDLNDIVVNGAGWTLLSANGINDSGQIVGTGTLNGETRAFLLTPLATVPEPASLILLCPGVAILLIVVGRRKARASDQQPRFGGSLG